MSNFTRGNWEILPPDGIENSYLIEAQNDDGIIETGTLICECYDEDNARLIAASVDMHDTLDEVAYFLEQVSSYDGDEFAQYARIIRQTLAQADGTEVKP